MKNESHSLHAALNAGRIAMLLEPVAEKFNDLLMNPPIRRVISVAESLNFVASNNETIYKIMNESGVISSLKEEGRSRGAGDVVVPQALVPDFERKIARESNNA
jgi:hypothetical protein